MRDKEDEKDGGIEMIRKKLHEWEFCPYHCQPFNYYESPDLRAPVKLLECRHLKMLQTFDRVCQEYISFNFQFETRMVGGVRLCSYSELQQITDFNKDSDRFIRKTLHGRLFHGTIGEGSEKRSAFVKTWDFVLPQRPIQIYRPYYFCNEIELFTNKNANTHPNLAKLSTFCCDTRLAAVYDGKFTRVLSDVLPTDDFVWDNRINVAIQLADLFVWLHEKGVVVGSINLSCIMIDEEMNIKVFDFGSVSNHVDGNSEIPLKFFLCRGAPDTGKPMVKSDVFIFGLLLLELIAKKDLEYTILHPSELGKECLVDESFKEVDPETASKISLLTYNCMDLEADNRPTMKYVLDVLKTTAGKMGVRGEKRKRDEFEAEKAATLLA